ncbi:MAG TPA: metal-dependent hydrolase [Candidatus Acidoferrum sp.]|nr:metal-dependent hydrolase [Candidatus Acidoferrum sp.]
MDIVTHALLSLALARGFFARRGWPVLAGMLVAGTLADVDLISEWFGPAAYLAGRRKFTHSLLGTIAIIVIAAWVAHKLDGKRLETWKGLLAATSCAAVVHLLFDFCQSAGIELLWPFHGTRYALDWLPQVDPWILFLLLGGVVVPEFLLLVSLEIGAKDKRPRGRNGALVALVLIGIYVGARGVLHFNSVALLEPRSYRGESPRRVESFAERLSLLTWHGVVETQSYLCLIDVPVTSGDSFDPEAATCLHKPEESPVLTAVQQSVVGRKFLSAARIPRAAVDKTEIGYEVVIRDLRDVAEQQTRDRVVARIWLDSASRIVSEQLAWAGEAHLR